MRERGIRSQSTEKNHGRQTSDLHGLSRDDAGRPARPRGDAARISPSTSATRPAATIRSAGRPRRRSTRRASRSPISSAPTRRRSCSRAARPSPTTSRSRASPRCTARRATTSSPCVTEHKAVIDTCKHLEKDGYRVTYLPVQKDGLDQSRRSAQPRSRDKTILISIMAANNEIGVIQPIAEIGAIAKEKGVLFHTDAVQAVGKVPFNVNELKVDLVVDHARTRSTGRRASARCTSGGATRACCSRRIIDGGGHERGMRSGTLNVPGIVGFGKAAELCRLEMAADSERLAELRDRPERPAAQAARRDLHQRLDGAPAAAQPEHQLRVRRRRVAADGHQRCRGVVGLGLHLGQPRAVLCAEGARRRRRSGALVDPFRPRPLDDRRRSRLRRRQADVGRHAAARDVAALRARERRRRSVDDAVAGRISRRTTWQIADVESEQSAGDWKHGLLGQSHRPLREPAQRRLAAERRLRTSAPAWSARRSAAT